MIRILEIADNGLLAMQHKRTAKTEISKQPASFFYTILNTIIQRETSMQKTSLPEIKTGDIIFISKNNTIGSLIKILEKTPKYFTCGGKTFTPMKQRKYSHAAISRFGTLFLETGMYTGAIQTPIDTLLDDPDIDDWKVFRHTNFTQLVGSEQTFYNANKKYLDTLYNMEFRHDGVRDSFFCSQLVTAILKEYELLDAENSNLGPNALYMNLLLCKKHWKDVTSEYKAYLADEKNKTFIKHDHLLEETDQRVRDDIKIQEMMEAAFAHDEEKLKQLKPHHPTHRVDKPLTARGTYKYRKTYTLKQKKRKKGALSRRIVQLDQRRLKASENYNTITRFSYVSAAFDTRSKQRIMETFIGVCQRLKSNLTEHEQQNGGTLMRSDKTHSELIGNILEEIESIIKVNKVIQGNDIFSKEEKCKSQEIAHQSIQVRDDMATYKMRYSALL